MYESPINKFIGEMQTQMVKDEEGQLMVRVTQAIGYDVDKDELIKALNYDRQQYEKGYSDGYKYGSNVNKWIPVSERLPKIAGVYRVTRFYPTNLMNPNYLVDACFFDGSNTWYDDNRINSERDYANNVIAWQEDPEPYKAESEEEK